MVSVLQIVITQASLTDLITELEEWEINEKDIVEFICKLKTTLTK